MNDLGSIAKASNENIFAFCAQQSKDIKDYTTRRDVARQDAQILDKVGTCSEEVFKITSAVIEAVKKCDSFESYDSLIFQMEGKQFKISGHNQYAKMIDECLFCPHKIGGPRKLKIENCITGVTLNFLETTLHDIEKHEYFGKEGTEFRIDPSLAWNLFK